jgi:predicted nucleotidyltransferase component of viral defense system
MHNIRLSQLQKNTLIFFGKNPFGKNFYWTGGTLLSYQYLHHRTSIDLDFFSNDLFADDQYLTFLKELKNQVRAEKITLTIQQNRQLYLAERGDEAVKLELVYFPFPAIERKSFLPEFSLKVDSLADIIVNKTLSIYQRNEPKDVFDLYCYLKNKPKYNLQKLIKRVEQKFGVAIGSTMLLAKINELAAQLDSISPLLIIPQKNLAKKVKEFFQNIFNSIAKKQIK